MQTTRANEKRIYQFTERYRGCENFGPVHTTTTETLTVCDGGIRVDSHVTGTCEGVRVNEKCTTFHANVTIERADAYRLSHGYIRIA